MILSTFFHPFLQCHDFSEPLMVFEMSMFVIEVRRDLMDLFRLDVPLFERCQGRDMISKQAGCVDVDEDPSMIANDVCLERFVPCCQHMREDSWIY